MCTRVLRLQIVFLRVLCSILILLTKTFRCTIPHCVYIYIYTLYVHNCAGTGSTCTSKFVRNVNILLVFLDGKKINLGDLNNTGGV